MPTPTPSPLCSICKDILQTEPDKSRDPASIKHHQTFQSFHDALRQGCFICTTTWDTVKSRSRSRNLLDEKAWNPMFYSLYIIAKQDNRIQLTITYWHFPQSGLNCNFAIVPDSAKEFERNHPLPSIASDTASSSSLDLACRWFSSCQNDHKSCDQLVKRQKWSPTRLIDIGISPSLTWKLCIPAEASIPPDKYMTLSYRWDASPSLTLTTSNFAAFCNGQLISNLPQTFRDMITVARRFSIRYMWIDCLCILQDSAIDWAKESSTMRDVYANSVLNITASASSSPHGGLFRTRDSAFPIGIIEKSTFQPGETETKTENYWNIIDFTYWDRHATNTPLQRRGWVFQERLLAPRALHFTPTQIFWECFGRQSCEQFPLGIPLHEPLRNFSLLFDAERNLKKTKNRDVEMDFEVMHTWVDLVDDYNACDLTFSSDKLVAISGLARLYADMTSDVYLAGLWKSRLKELLYWQVDSDEELPSALENEGGVYRAPSWSWAHRDFRTDYRYIIDTDVYLLDVVEAEMQLETDDSTGKVSGGFLVVEGLVFPGAFLAEGERVGGESGEWWYEEDMSNKESPTPKQKPKDGKYKRSHVSRKIRVQKQELESMADGDQEVSMTMDSWEEGKGEGEKVLCLALKAFRLGISTTLPEEQGFGVAGLVLREVGGGEEEEGEKGYVRIGLWDIYGNETIVNFGILVDKETGNVIVDPRMKRRRVRII
ncbi:hypothetical protein G7Y89_g15225 [Cudoniella acicularis]|uniref:Heterokaryon incompatibility domain-containing protein n=1 Tax=Cudoniella acicularis TaxID=354080 RepID=A0A8H4VNJ5_9HELO|nr:hypothetical protein G7Y89_g15225 [Cudoniella acicularis]